MSLFSLYDFDFLQKIIDLKINSLDEGKMFTLCKYSSNIVTGQVRSPRNDFSTSFFVGIRLASFYKELKIQILDLFKLISSEKRKKTQRKQLNTRSLSANPTKNYFLFRIDPPNLITLPAK